MDLGFLKEFGMENNPHFVSATDFFAGLSPDERVFLLIRHSIRRHITPADTDNGAHVGLTDEGRALAINLGKLFPEGSTVYFSSPVGRCLDTAKCIEEGRLLAGRTPATKPDVDFTAGSALVKPTDDAGLMAVASEIAALKTEGSAVAPVDCLGDFYVKDYDAYLGVLNEHFYQNICDWVNSDNHPAFFPLSSRAQELREFMLALGTARFNIFATHDCWVVPTLMHFCGFRFTPSHWMNFLTGIAFVEGPRGERIVPVTGMDTGFQDF